jgi:hypothetical protein
MARHRNGDELPGLRGKRGFFEYGFVVPLTDSNGICGTDGRARAKVPANGPAGHTLVYGNIPMPTMSRGAIVAKRGRFLL